MPEEVADFSSILRPNKHGLVTYIQVNVYIANSHGSTVDELSKLTYVED